MKMRIALASDHAGVKLKEELVRFLGNTGYDVDDMGPVTEDSVDYPDTIAPAARAVVRGAADRAVIICGSGIGASIVANKIRGVRCVLCQDIYDAEYSRAHNDTNVIAFGARKFGIEKVTECLVKWLSTPFEGGRHAARLAKIKTIEDEEARGAK
jgi:ribose 5-phosphate isomerase B